MTPLPTHVRWDLRVAGCAWQRFLVWASCPDIAAPGKVELKYCLRLIWESRKCVWEESSLVTWDQGRGGWRGPVSPCPSQQGSGFGEALGSLRVQKWEAQMALGPLCAPCPCPAGPPHFGGSPGCHSKAPQAECVQTAETDPLPLLEAAAPSAPWWPGGSLHMHGVSTLSPL